MIFELLLSYGSTIFLLILILVYYSKLTFKNAREKFFKWLFWLAFAFAITDFLTLWFVKFIPIALLDYFFGKAHWLIGISWWAFFFNYCMVVIKKIDLNNGVIDVFKYNKLNLITTIIIGIISIGYLFLPKAAWDLDNITFITGSIAAAIAVFMLILASIIIGSLYKNKKNTTPLDKFTIIFTISFMAAVMVFQVIFPAISFIPIGYILCIYSLYFNMEDPDLTVINEIKLAKDDIVKTSQTKTDFLSNMSYGIKTPINVIMGLCDELINLTNFNDDTLYEDIRQIQISGNSLLDIVNNVLDISKIESGKDVSIEREYKIKDILIDVINIANNKIGKKSVKLNISIDNNISSVLKGDSSKLYQSLLNLITNSIKYTEVGKINFTVTSTKTGDTELFKFIISDTGAGIKEEDQSNIFVKKAKTTDNTENDGGGFGLVITKEYIESMGGKIWFESEYRVGSKFYIELSQKICDPTPIGNIFDDNIFNKDVEKLDCSKYKILIVEDDELNMKVIKRFLEEYKFELDGVFTGKDCIQKIKQDEHFDLILMDHMMSDMNGIETLHVLRKLPGYTLPPIVALTANAIEGMKERYLSEGFDEYLSKPVNTNELDRVIRKFFDNK